LTDIKVEVCYFADGSVTLAYWYPNGERVTWRHLWQQANIHRLEPRIFMKRAIKRQVKKDKALFMSWWLRRQKLGCETL
jgi:hypothetical protein